MGASALNYQAFNIQALESFINVNFTKPKKRRRLFNDVLLIARGAREALNNGRSKNPDDARHTRGQQGRS